MIPSTVCVRARFGTAGSRASSSPNYETRVQNPPWRPQENIDDCSSVNCPFLRKESLVVEWIVRPVALFRFCVLGIVPLLSFSFLNDIRELHIFKSCALGLVIECPEIKF